MLLVQQAIMRDLRLSVGILAYTHTFSHTHTHSLISHKSYYIIFRAMPLVQQAIRRDLRLSVGIRAAHFLSNMR